MSVSVCARMPRYKDERLKNKTPSTYPSINSIILLKIVLSIDITITFVEEEGERY